MLDRTIIEDALPPVVPAPVAHYTRIGTLSHFIPHGTAAWTSAWATPVQFLNDRMELSLGLDVLSAVANRKPQSGRRVRGIIDNLLTSVGRLETDAFQMSFSGNPDELGQWRGYASNGMGCSVVTDAVAIKNVADVAGWVIYDDNRQVAFASKVLHRLENVIDDDEIERALVASASYMKHEGFQPENEFRLLKFPTATDVRFRETGNRLVPYVDVLNGIASLPISRVIIGPGWKLSRLKTAEWSRNHIVQGIHRLLTARGMHATGIESSKIPYDPT